jgi:hypothetical protein
MNNNKDNKKYNKKNDIVKKKELLRKLCFNDKKMKY